MSVKLCMWIDDKDFPKLKQGLEPLGIWTFPLVEPSSYTFCDRSEGFSFNDKDSLKHIVGSALLEEDYVDCGVYEVRLELTPHVIEQLDGLQCLEKEINGDNT